MQNPVIALIWECWRLSRRWYLWVLPVALGIDFFFMSQADSLVQRTQALQPPLVPLDLANAYQVLAPSVFIVNFTLAIFTALLAISVGGRSGFPLAFEFRLPIRSAVLVAVPMLTLATLCASLYFVPILLCRLLFGVPFPILPAIMLIGTLVIIMLASSWATTSTPARTMAMLFAMFNSVQLFALLDPMNLKLSGPPMDQARFNPDIVALSPAQYALLIGICVGLYVLALAAIRKQRYGEATAQPAAGLAPANRHRTLLSVSGLRNRATDLLSLPCPTAAPWRAELWLEAKRHGIPVVLLGALLALIIPLLYAVSITPGNTSDRLDYLFPLIIFFSGIGIAVFNRREVTAGYMSAFEGTRGVSTVALALLQVLAVAASILCGIALVCVSAYFSAELFDTSGGLAALMQSLVAAKREAPVLLMLSETLMQLAIYVSLVALFACVHTWSVVWGRILPYGAGILAIYGLVFAYRVQSERADLEEIRQHMWGFATMVLLLTLFALGRTLYSRILSLRAGVMTITSWVVFLACALYTLAQREVPLMNQQPELQALNAALLLLPLTLCVLLFWSYDRLRHR